MCQESHSYVSHTYKIFYFVIHCISLRNAAQDIWLDIQLSVVYTTCVAEQSKNTIYNEYEMWYKMFNLIISKAYT